MIFYFIL